MNEMNKHFSLVCIGFHWFSLVFIGFHWFHWGVSTACPPPVTGRSTSFRLRVRVVRVVRAVRGLAGLGWLAGLS